MSSAIFELNAESRTDVGKGASRRLRHDDKVPAIIYGAGSKPMNLTLEHRHVIKALSFEAFYSHILTLDIDGKKEKAVLKALQRHPYKSKILHMDFLRINEKEAITLRVPLHVIGADVAPGVKTGGGSVMNLMTELEITCLPADLPEFIEVDISTLEAGNSVHLSHLTLPKGVSLATAVTGPDNDSPVVSIQARKGVSESDSADAAVGEDNAAAADADTDAKK